MRNQLPFREKTELFLINEFWNIIAEDHGTYLMFPWWWIDFGEPDRKQSAIRELYEETGYEIHGSLFPICTVSWVWFPEWANTEKRSKRYQQYQGERVHIFIWRVKSKNSFSIELDKEQKYNDTWEYTGWINANECLKLFTKYALHDHPNTYAYRVAQYSAILSSFINASINLDIDTSDLRTDEQI